MSVKRRNHSPEFKFRVALEAAKEQKTIAQLASEFNLHPTQIGNWKKRLLEDGKSVFQSNGKHELQTIKESELYEQIGRLKMELECLCFGYRVAQELKKNLPSSVDEKRILIEPTHPVLSVRRQCELIGLNRGTYYYQPAKETPLNLALMRLIDEQYLKTPFYGYPKMTEYLRNQGYWVSPKRIARLMRVMGLQAVGFKRRITRSNHEHKVYPYLLRNVPIIRTNQVWSADITYVPMNRGFMYLVAILDWFSRYVLSWQISNTLDNMFCTSALEKAFRHGQPEIFNTDQGVQFTSSNFTEHLESAGVKISMDGRGRVFDNIFIERLWRTVKYEDIYLKSYDTVTELDQGLERYFRFYNNERFHQSLDYMTPSQVYYDFQGAKDG